MDQSSVSPPTTESYASSSAGHRVSKALFLFSALLCLLLSLAYWLRPDALAAVTVVPVLCWSFVGLLLTGLGWRPGRTGAVKALTAIWLLFTLLFAEEPHSLLRTLLPVPATDKEAQLRVVSLNCSAGDPPAAAEVVRWQPDVVLLQESPSKADTKRLAHTLFGADGSFVWGVDGSILARGALTSQALAPELTNYFVQARLRMPDGRQAEVFSLRLMTPPFRMDWWSGDCWRAHSHNRDLQTAQMAAIKSQLEALPAERAVILGGDFNAPQGDAIFRALQPRVRDSFARAGRGWGNTIINDFPALRIDQIWASAALQPRSVVAIRTQNSDHRAVIADFAWPTK